MFSAPTHMQPWQHCIICLIVPILCNCHSANGPPVSTYETLWGAWGLPGCRFTVHGRTFLHCRYCWSVILCFPPLPCAVHCLIRTHSFSGLLRCITYVQPFFSVDSTANGSAFVKSPMCSCNWDSECYVGT